MRLMFILRLLPALMVLVGCSPIIRTSYSFEPPAAVEARACVDQCMKTNTQCWRTCDLRTPNCGDATLYPGATLPGQETGPMPDFKSPLGMFGSGRADCIDLEPIIQSGRQCKDACDGLYRQCYARCGGTVVAHPVCTAFCDDKTP